MSRTTITRSKKNAKQDTHKKDTPTKKPRKKSKTRYKVTNWKEYNEALRQRGSIDTWIDEEIFERWYAEKETVVGAPKRYSDVCIQTCLTLKGIYTGRLRQTEGLVRSILCALGRAEDVPDFSTLSRRNKTCSVAVRVRDAGDHLELYPDSTGLKESGEGEWKVRTHGVSKRRTWIKMHLTVTPESDILAAVVTDNETHDCEVVEGLLDVGDGTINTFGTDGAYDTRATYDLLQQRGIQDIRIPPREGAKIWYHGNLSGPPHPRDQNLRAIRTSTKRAWKRACGYHARSISETAMFRYKTTFGGDVRARTFDRQTNEVRINVRSLNIMTTLGMPTTEKVTC